jgi:hypothetical protein
MRQIQRALYFLFLFILVSCTPAGTPTSIPDFSSLLQSSCSAPCWNGITPGKTTKSEFLELIPSLPRYKEIGVGWMDGKGQLTSEVPDTPNLVAVLTTLNNAIGIYIQNSVVSAITIRPTIDKSNGADDYGLSLEDMQKLYGDPSNILKGGACDDFKCEKLFFIYPDQGVIFITQSKDFVASNGVFPSHIRILPELAVQEVLFLNPAEFKGIPISVDIGNIHCEIEDEIPSWQGYTTVDFSKVGSYCN